MENDSKVEDILHKLNILNCPLSGNSKDTWLTEILFKPCFKRYNLIEWTLEKLGINHESTGEILENDCSLDRKVQNLLEILSALGVCDKKDKDIIEGTASQEKQLSFWELLCNIALRRAHILNSSFSTNKNDNSTFESNKVEQFESCCNYVHKVCESANFSHIFDTNLQLFPIHLKKEMKTFFQENVSTLSSENIKKTFFEHYDEKEFNENAVTEIEDDLIYFNEPETVIIPNESALNETENNISGLLCDLQDSSKEFNNAYNSLKPYLSEVLSTEFTDVGPAFKATAVKLKSVLELKNSSTSLKETDSTLKALNSDVSNFQISSGCLSDSKLEEYISIISNSNETK